LRKKGFKTFACDVSEFMKAGGAVKCMSLPLG
jgi:N-dimethylarginine dimethylaminohydrolase